MKIPSDTTLLDMIENHQLEIESPDDENYSWVIYSPMEPLGAGLACSKNLRVALLKAYAKLNQNNVEYTD